MKKQKKRREKKDPFAPLDMRGGRKGGREKTECEQKT